MSRVVRGEKKIGDESGVEPPNTVTDARSPLQAAIPGRGFPEELELPDSVGQVETDPGKLRTIAITEEP